ncbi:Ribosomal RNA-processing protein 8 [Orchesella cincta]|uniref:Ribosomal RNA-processing protein 8 n=1 Tax=Orchesella cincta TaxID=48709 RepID=A0A1D2NHP7_ORCCI|nr:Ribosomal RNA-processing protein 8 [Orchesella cincta]
MGRNSAKTRPAKAAGKRKDRVKKKEKKTWKSVKEKRNSVKSVTPEAPKKAAQKPSSNVSLRHLNEESSKSIPLANLSEFRSYHEGFTSASSSWKTHPLDWIIKYINENVDESKIVADFGCGTARLSESIKQTTHSFDLHALKDHVTQCDVRNTPLDHESVDVVVFCLSLMGCDVFEYINEASRVLKTSGVLIIAETCSKVHPRFANQIKSCGFKVAREETLGNNVFNVLVFHKIRRVAGKRLCYGSNNAYKRGIGLM